MNPTQPHPLKGQPIVETIFSEKEAAARMRLSPRTLERFRLSGAGPNYVKAGRRILYRECDLSEWLAANTVRPGTGEPQ